MAYSPTYVGDPGRLASVCAAAILTCADTASARSLVEAGCHVIMQNALQADTDGALPATLAARAHHLHMFPQQQLQRRRGARARTIARVVFMGDRHQICPSLTSPDFLARLRAVGVTFDVVDKSRIAEWADYRDADLVLAVRPPGTQVELKPPSKLINAWLAGVPALLGPEPAYQRLKRHPHDFIEVSVPAEVFDAIMSLRRDPEQYAAMLRRCEARAAEFTADAIAGQWADVLFNRVQRALTPLAASTIGAARAPAASGAEVAEHSDSDESIEFTII